MLIIATVNPFFLNVKGGKSILHQVSLELASRRCPILNQTVYGLRTFYHVKVNVRFPRVLKRLAQTLVMTGERLITYTLRRVKPVVIVFVLHPKS